MIGFRLKFLLVTALTCVPFLSTPLSAFVARPNAQSEQGSIPGLGIALILDHSSLASGGESKRTREVEDAMRASGFQVRRINALTKNKSLEEIANFAKSVPTNAVTLVYYVGPMVLGEKKVNSKYSDETFFVTPDFQFKDKRDVRSKCISIHDLYVAFQDSGCRGMILLADQLLLDSKEEKLQELQQGIRVFENESTLNSLILLQKMNGKTLANQITAKSPYTDSKQLIDHLKGLTCLSKTREWEPDKIAGEQISNFVRWSYFDAQAQAGNKPGEIRVNSIGQVFCWVPPGTFRKGSPEKEEFRNRDETQQEVKVDLGFWVSKYEITEKEYYLATKRRPRERKGNNFPYSNGRHGDAKRFAESLNKLKPPETRQWTYSVPTESEWEYACRAGSNSSYCFGDDPKQLPQFGNFADLALYKKDPSEFRYADTSLDDRYSGVAPVGSFAPNTWGIHDMHGNVWEWCSETYRESTQESIKSGQKAYNDLGRVIRGGSWISYKHYCRCAMRNAQHDLNDSSYIGIRIILRSN